MSRPGQTLLEGIIAISVITVGLMAVVGLAISNSTNAQINNDRALATALAREGLEVAKHVRDSDWLAGAPFGTSLLGGDYAVPQSTFTGASPTWSLLFGGGSYGDLQSPDTLVRVVETPGQERFSQPSGATATKFHRHLTLRSLCRSASDRGTSFAYHLGTHTTCGAGEDLVGAQVLSEVQWRQALGYRTVKLEIRLFDWR